MPAMSIIRFRRRDVRASSNYLRLCGFRKRTPKPPPFSSRNTTPADSSACCIFAEACGDTRAPVPVSNRFTVGRDNAALSASSV